MKGNKLNKLNKLNKVINGLKEFFNKILKLTTSKLLLLGFAVLIIIGALILNTRLCLSNSEISFIDALFVSTSAISTTGLSTICISETFNVFGIFILMILMQVGAIGFITFVCFMFQLLGKKLPLKNRVTFEESFDFGSTDNVRHLVFKIINYVLIVELIGTILLSFRFIPMFGFSHGILLSIFQSISAFCNNGLDLFGSTSLAIFKSDFYVNIIIMLLIFFGSIGYIVVFDVIKKIKYTIINGYSFTKVFKKLTLNSKLVLASSLWLIVIGAVILYVIESFNPETLGSMPIGNRIITALFHSVSARSGGLTTIDMSKLFDSSILFYIILMFIGGSPASCGGGIKNITVAVLFLTMRSIMKGDDKNTVAFNRNISHDTVRKAIVIFFLGVSLVITGSIAISLIDDFDMLQIVFEVVSAFATCGASLGITAHLSSLSKIIIMILMFIGRLGIVTFLLSINKNENGGTELVEYPEERIMIIS